ncbi:MAG: hypothetical protein HOM52_06145 [Rhodospirillaceae bacterium]|nr:hypothetical protein [Rhodospirillaceae bacterium]MBT5038072.1 hypothetical protein [Rhodospirillaceae bacterium]
MLCAFRVATISVPSVALILGAFAGAPAAGQLTPEQAALCSHLQNQMQSLDEALEAYDGRIAHAHRLIEGQGELLQDMKEGLDQSDSASVQAYNENVDQYARTIKRYNGELLPELARRRDAFNAKVREYNKDCAGKEVR